MTTLYRVIAAVLLVCVYQTSTLGGPKRLELRWAELSPLISGRPVEITLADGSILKGQAVVVRSDSLVMNVTHMSGGKTYRTGSGVIPRHAISLIRVKSMPGTWGRKLGTTIGVLTGVTVGGYVAGHNLQSAATGIPLFLG